MFEIIIDFLVAVAPIIASISFGYMYLKRKEV